MGNWNAVLKNWTPKTKTFIIRKLELVLPKSEGFDIENWISVSKIELLERRLSKSKSEDKSDFGWRKYARTMHSVKMPPVHYSKIGLSSTKSRKFTHW